MAPKQKPKPQAPTAPSGPSEFQSDIEGPQIVEPMGPRYFAHVKCKDKIFPVTPAGSIRVHAYHAVANTRTKADWLAKHREFVEFPAAKLLTFIGECAQQENEGARVYPHKIARMLG